MKTERKKKKRENVDIEKKKIFKEIWNKKEKVMKIERKKVLIKGKEEVDIEKKEKERRYVIKERSGYGKERMKDWKKESIS